MHANYIAGEWVTSDRTIENRNPSDVSDLIGLYAQADKQQLERALDAAQQAQKIWATTGLEQRQNVLFAIGQELMTRADELGQLLSREEGKPLAEGRGEVYRAGQFFTYYAAEVLRQIGDRADSVRPGVEILVQREPVGTVAIISPWNFPTATAAWKIAPALAFGNAVIWKPANLVPASAHALAEIIHKQCDQGMPAGLFNLLMGPGHELGDQLIQSRAIDAISFTGSLEVGRSLIAKAVPNLTRVQMEMGSKNALLVLDDADLDTAVQCALGGAFGGSGQKCTASSRLIVQRALHDEFVERLVDGAQKMVVEHALKAGTQVGPVVSAAQLKSNLDYVALGVQAGAHLACGGEALKREHEGHYMAPTVLTKTDNTMRVNREEMFAPITCVIEVDDYAQGLAVLNDTEFGLTGGIITRSLAKANHFRAHAKTGCVMVNLPTAGTDYHVPFGGRGSSSYGPREQGSYAAEFYTAVKTSYISAGDIG